MKILFLSHSAGRTGAPIVLLNLIKWLRQNTDWEIEILLKEGGPLGFEFGQQAPTWQTDGFRVGARSNVFRRLFQKLGGNMTSRAAKRQAELWARFDSRQFDLIYSNTITNGALLTELSRLGAPVLTHIHEMGHWIRSCGEENLSLVKRHSCSYIAASNAVKTVLVNDFGFVESEVFVVHEFVPALAFSSASRCKTTELKRQLGISSESLVIVGSGYESLRKGKDLFVELARLLLDRAPDLDFVFLWMGGWDNSEHESDVRRAVTNHKLEEHIRFVGEVSNPMDYMAIGDIFTLVSRDDPFPLVCLEAASLQIPVLCFDGAGGMPEFVEEDAGYVIPFLDVDAMANRVIDLARNEELRMSMGATAKSKVQSRHDVACGASQIMQHVQFVVRASKDRGSPGTDLRR